MNSNAVLASQLWLAVLVGCLAAYGWHLWRNRDYSLWETLLYLPAYLLARLLWRVHFSNQPPQELQRGAVLAANHHSSIDPMFIQLAARRRVHWFVAKEYCQHPILGLLLKPLQVIPTNRSGMDLKATKVAIDYARQGRLVGIFPEGKINVTNDLLLPIRAGAAMVAVKSGAPIVPLYIQGSPYRGSVLNPLITPARVKVTFGNPVYPHAQSDANQLPAVWQAPAGNTQQLAAELIEQWGREIMRLAGQLDFRLQVGSARRRPLSESLDKPPDSVAS